VSNFCAFFLALFLLSCHDNCSAFVKGPAFLGILPYLRAPRFSAFLSSDFSEHWIDWNAVKD
jgi:hypothetical protein